MRPVSPKWHAGVVLVCTHERPPEAEKSSCGYEQGVALRDWLKARLKADGLKGPVLCAKSSCLGICPARGTTVAVIPGPGTHMVRQVFVTEPDEPYEAIYEQVLACLPVADE